MERNVRYRKPPVAAVATPEADAAPNNPQSLAAVGAKSAPEVGYGKPPVHSRFKKGRSGNPRGRPKGAKDLQTLFKRELGSKVTITEGGQPREVTKREAMVKRFVNEALKGDHKALQAVLKADAESVRLVEALARETVASAANEGDDATDRAILEAFRNQLHAEWAMQCAAENGNPAGNGGTDNDE